MLAELLEALAGQADRRAARPVAAGRPACLRGRHPAGGAAIGLATPDQPGRGRAAAIRVGGGQPGVVLAEKASTDHTDFKSASQVVSVVRAYLSTTTAGTICFDLKNGLNLRNLRSEQ